MDLSFPLEVVLAWGSFVVVMGVDLRYFYFCGASFFLGRGDFRAVPFGEGVGKSVLVVDVVDIVQQEGVILSGQEGLLGSVGMT